MICNSCGGVVGRDCFNQQECAWITRDMAARAQAETLPPEADVEAVAWAYRKLLDYGVANTTDENALMMDRLKLMLQGEW